MTQHSSNGRARVYKAPQKYPKVGLKVFLAGSIDMGKAEDWQTELTKLLEPYDIGILNPRRDDWDDSWKQSLEDKRFVKQVEWELKAMEDANIIVVHFSKGSFSPITLLELGLHAKSGKQIVYCPDGFYRKGNVDVVCNRYWIEQVESIEELAQAVIEGLEAQPNEPS